jgi:hypothetical protein
MKSTKLMAAVCAALLTGVVLFPSAIAAPAATTPPKGQFTNEAEAKASCPSDNVVWINLRSRVYHSSASTSYGKTKRGIYMCEKEASAAGYRTPKPRRTKTATPT